MGGRGRRIAIALILLALALSAGRWSSAFLGERLWEATVSERVAISGVRRALFELSLELAVLALAFSWFLLQLSIAARIALPERRPPERDAGRVWPAQLPRWSLAVLALVMATLLAGGAGGWLDQLLLTLDGARLGIPDPLLGADLGAFLGSLPLRVELQRLATLLVGAALGSVVLVHIAGDTIRISGQRVRVSPRARGQLAVLLALLAVTLAWSFSLEPYRLAAGLRGPLLPSEFLLRTTASRVASGLGLLAALFSVLWSFRFRALAAVACWVLLAIAMVAGRVVAPDSEAATADPAWRTAAHTLDSVAFQLSGLEQPRRPLLPAAQVVPTLWDEAILERAAADSGSISEPRRGWIDLASQPQPVWLAVSEHPSRAPALLALSDDRVGGAGGLLSWREGDTVPVAGVHAFRELPAHSVRPGAREVELSKDGSGVRLDSWATRLVLAWALQKPAAFSAPAGTRVAWRLDPALRLSAVAPFAHWTAPRARLLGDELVWQSDGLLSAAAFPASGPVEWEGSTASMVRSSFLGVVHAGSGQVHIYARDPADSLALAWARITRPLIEAPAEIPPQLRTGSPYPEDLLRAQARALEGPAWGVGRLERLSAGTSILPPAASGGTDYLVPILSPDGRRITALLAASRSSTGDSLRLIQLDSLHLVDAGKALQDKWSRFPFRTSLHDSVIATGSTLLDSGRVRYALAQEGVVAYQPVWSVSASERAQLVLVNVALSRKNGESPLIGTGRNLAEAWKNLRNEMAPGPVGAGAEAVLEQARRLIQLADSARTAGDLQERERLLTALRDLIVPRRP